MNEWVVARSDWVLACDSCVVTIELGAGAWDEADRHEQQNTDHWVHLVQQAPEHQQAAGT